MNTGIPRNGKMVKNRISFGKKKNSIRIHCNTEKFVFIVDPGLSLSSSGSSSTSKTPYRQKSHSSSSFSASFSSPTASEIKIRKREDGINSDTSPVQMSTSVDDKSGQLDETQTNNIQKPNRKKTTIKRGNPLCSDIPELLQEFRENLVDDEVPEHGNSHASSSHDVSVEPTTKRREDLGKHNVHNHFHKDRNCEIRKRTKITSAPCRKLSKTITDMQSSCQTWPLRCYNPTHAKQNLTGNPKDPSEVSGTRLEA